MDATAYIPSYVIDWTDRYFHQSAFDVPVGFPNKKVIKFLARFKKHYKVRLYRGVNSYNRDNGEITSWSYSRQVAEMYAEGSCGEIIETEFLSSQILLDTTLLTTKERESLGYDYIIDDKEVLIMGL